jgi:hypothetical protein
MHPPIALDGPTLVEHGCIPYNGIHEERHCAGCWTAGIFLGEDKVLTQGTKQRQDVETEFPLSLRQAGTDKESSTSTGVRSETVADYH